VSSKKILKHFSRKRMWRCVRCENGVK
jgi:hypothetical protein